jgi:hypothetical protein
MSIIKRVNALTEPSLTLNDYNINDSLLKPIFYECKNIQVNDTTQSDKKPPSEPEILVSRNAEYLKKTNKNAFNEITNDCIPDIPFKYVEDTVDKYIRILVNCQEPEEASPEEDDIDKMIEKISNEIKFQSKIIQKINSARLALFASLEGDYRKLDANDVELLKKSNDLILEYFAEAKLPGNAYVDI